MYAGSTRLHFAVGSILWCRPGHPPGNHQDLSLFVLARGRWRLHSDARWTPWIVLLKTWASCAAAHATCWFGKVCRWKMMPPSNIALCYGKSNMLSRSVIYKWVIVHNYGYGQLKGKKNKDHEMMGASNWMPGCNMMQQKQIHLYRFVSGNLIWESKANGTNVTYKQSSVIWSYIVLVGSFGNSKPVKKINGL